MTIVSSGQIFVVSTGTVGGITVMGGGSVVARTGGITSGAILSGGDEYVSSGSEAIKTTVRSGGALIISSGGSASGASVKTGGSETVSSGASDLKAVISGGNATQYVDGGSTTGTRLRIGGTQIVSSGGIAISSYVSAQAYQDIGAGGEAKGTIINGGNLIVSSGGISVNTIDNVGTIEVLLGGKAENSFIGSGSLSVFGVSLGATIESGAYEGAGSGGVIISSTVYGQENVVSGGVVSATLVYGAENLGNLDYAGGESEASKLFAGGGEEVYAGGVARGTFIEGGYLQVLRGGTAINPMFAVNPGGTLELTAGSAVVSGSITFAINDATLQIDTKTMPTAIISGFAPTDVIALTSVIFNKTDTISVVGNEVTLGTPTGNYTLDIAGASNDTFEVLKAPSGTDLEVTNTGAPTLAGLNWQAMTSPEDRASLNPNPFVMSAIIHGAASIIPETSVPPSMMILNHE